MPAPATDIAANDAAADNIEPAIEAELIADVGSPESGDAGASRLFVGRLDSDVLAGHVPSKRQRVDRSEEQPMEAEQAARLVLRDLREGKLEPAAPPRDDLAGPLWRLAGAAPPLPAWALPAAPAAPAHSPLRMPVPVDPQPAQQLEIRVDGVAFRAEAVWKLTPLDKDCPALQVPLEDAPTSAQFATIDE